MLDEGLEYLAIFQNFGVAFSYKTNYHKFIMLKQKSKAEYRIVKSSRKKSSAFWKNEARMKLLVLLPSFQTDVTKIRDEFNIFPQNLQNPEEIKEWYKQLIRKNKNELFYKKIEDLGKKYRLPANFFKRPFNSYGIIPYVVRNIVVAPSNNWAIEHDPEGNMKKGSSQWLSLKTFAPLSKKEIMDSMRFLKTLQQDYFPTEVTFPLRVRKQFERDLMILKKLYIERKNHPIKRRQYLSGSYLDRITRKHSMSNRKRRELERMHKKNIFVGYDALISKEVAKQLGIKRDAVRKALERSKKIARALFGNLF